MAKLWALAGLAVSTRGTMGVGIKVVNDGGMTEIIVKGMHRLAKACLAVIAVVIAWGGLRSQMAPFALLMDALFIALFANMLFGAQVLSLKGNELILTKKIGPLTVKKPAAFKTENIANVRLEAKDFPFKGKPNTEYFVVFDYSGQRQVLLEFLKKEQADSLLAGPLKTLLMPHS
jgi:hypothetical protein